MKKILITICVAVGVYFAFSNTIDEFLYPEKRPGLNTYDTYTTTTQQTTTTVTQQTPIVTDEDGYEPRDDRKPDYVQPADPTWSKRTFNWTSYDKQYTFEISMNIQDDMYEYYHSLLRYSYVKDYHNYVSDDNNHKLVKQLADEIKSLCDQCGYGESETIRETANFVQSIEYVLVPFLLRVLQLADQLSVSAVARGAERPGVRGSYYEKRIGARDHIAAAACAIVTASYLVLERSMA